jgi:hypothetical protein
MCGLLSTHHDFMSTRPSRAGELFRVRNDAPNAGEQLTSNSSQPAAMACSRSLFSPYADMPMIGDVVDQRIGLEDPHAFPAINDRHFEVH